MPVPRLDRLSLALLLGCLGLAVAALGPRVWPRPRPPALIQPQIRVSIEGSVARPGAHRLPFGARVEDLIELAGGFLPTAERSLVQLAAPLTDGQVVVVPALTGATHSPRVSLNSAGAAELLTLPGVGPATAERIIEHRPYSRVEDLLRVPGIGPKKLERLRGLVAL